MIVNALTEVYEQTYVPNIIPFVLNYSITFHLCTKRKMEKSQTRHERRHRRSTEEYVWNSSIKSYYKCYCNIESGIYIRIRFWGIITKLLAFGYGVFGLFTFALVDL